MRVDVVIAWPGRYLERSVELPEGAVVADAVEAAALDPGGESRACAIHGVLARTDQPLRDGDRLELLRPLLVDPKEARRRRARGP
ncbi:RnfH family protein [[Pseudomonas] boreopolis]|uniref:RnfH family protein n=1 Tax=Xanthomonas boreopolis TaxID=86183 RepID=UPI003D9B866F